MRFADGTLIDTELADDFATGPRCIGRDAGTAWRFCSLCRCLSASGGNLDDGQESAARAAGAAEQVTVQELAGHERSELAVLRHALTLRLSTEENAAFLTCPVASGARRPGAWIVDPEFIPPLLSLAASSTLVSELGELLHRLAGPTQTPDRPCAVKAMRGWLILPWRMSPCSGLLNALNSAEPVLSELHQYPSRHPELLYRELASGRQSADFLLEHHLEAIPATGMPRQSRYSHRCLPCWIRCSKSACPSRVIAIVLEQGADREIWRGRLHDARLREGADFYLSVRSSSLTSYRAAFRSSVRRVAMMMSPRSSILPLSGIAIKPLSHVPAAIPLRLENQYFALDLSTDAARAMLEAGNCTFYTPESLGDVKLELFAVLRLANTSESDLINKTFLPGLADGQPVTLRPAGDGWRGALSPGLSMGDRGARRR